MLVIKSLTLSLETNNEIFSIKDNIKELEDSVCCEDDLNKINNAGGLEFMKSMISISDILITKIIQI